PPRALLDSEAMLADGSVVADRYRIVGTIGAGPHGVVYRADDGGTTVALKVVDEPDAARAEAMLAAAGRAPKLGAPRGCHVLAAGREGSLVWVARELAVGRSLAAILDDEGRLEAGPAASVLVAICGALDAVHAAGLLHGSLKPENIVVGRDGAVKLTDL